MRLPQLYHPSESQWDDIDIEELTVVEISPDTTTPQGIARNALMEEFTWLDKDADWVMFHEDMEDVTRYLETLGMDYTRT